MSKSKQNLGESSLILIISTLLVKIISAFFKIPLANENFLGDLGFGYFSIAHDFFMPFYVLAISGLPVAVSHMTAELITNKRFTDVKHNFYITRKLFIILGIVCAIIISLISIPIILLTEAEINTLYSILTITPSVFLCFLLSVYRGYFEGFCNMLPTAFSKLIEALSKLFFGLILSYFVIRSTNNPGLAAAAAISSISIGTLLSTLYLHFKFKNNQKNNLLYSDKKGTNNTKISTILILAIPFALSSLASSFVALIDVFSVKLLISNASNEYLQIVTNQNNYYLNDIATYLYSIRSKAFTLYNLIPTITMSLGVGALPILTEFSTKRDNLSFRKNINQLLKTVSLITFPAGLGMIALSSNIMDLLYSNNEPLGSNLLTIFGIAMIFTGISIPFITILQSINLSLVALKHIIVGIIIKTLLNIILISIPAINIYGSAISTLFCYVYISISLFIIILKNIPKIDIINCVIKPLIAAFICVIPSYIICIFNDDKLATIISIFIAIVVYLILVCLFKILKREEILDFQFLKKFFNSSRC